MSVGNPSSVGGRPTPDRRGGEPDAPAAFHICSGQPVAEALPQWDFPPAVDVPELAGGAPAGSPPTLAQRTHSSGAPPVEECSAWQYAVSPQSRLARERLAAVARPPISGPVL